MIEKLISSKARVEILKLFLFNPRDSYYQSQIASLAHQPIRAVQRELKRLQEIGLVMKSSHGNRTLYQANRKCAIFEELKSIFRKTVGIAAALKGILEDKDAIKLAFFYGSYAKGEESSSSDIDLMVVGDISSRELSRLLAKPKREFVREINYAHFPENEFRQRVKRRDHFLTSVLAGKKVFLIGDDDELKKIISTK